MGERDFIAEIAATQHLGDDSTLCRRLIGKEQLWLQACQQAAQQLREQWLLPHLPGTQLSAWPLGMVREDLPPHYEPLLRSIAGCAYIALCLRRPAELDDVVLRADLVYETAALWTRTRLRFASMPVEPDMPLDPALRGRLSEILRLQEHPPHQRIQALATEIALVRSGWQIAAFRDLVEHFLDDATASWTRYVYLDVLLDKDDTGQVATLRLEMRTDGLGACYPDPRSMAFFECDQQFVNAQNTAWAYVHAQPRSMPRADVRWTLHAQTMPNQRSRYLDSIGGGSIGAGFGVGLRLLLDPQCPPPYSDWALTGAIDADGSLRSVQGYPAKLDVARREGKHVILPMGDSEQVIDEIAQWKTRFSATELALNDLGTVEQAVAAIIQAPVPVSFQELVPRPALPIPATTPQFAGRAIELAYLAEQLQSRHLAVIVGPSGVGKTSLGAQLAHQVARPGRLLWHRFRAGEDVGSIVEDLALLLAQDNYSEPWVRIKRADLLGTSRKPDILLNELTYAAQGRDLVLWLDDAQHVAQDPLLFDLIVRIQHYSGEGAMKLILCSQERIAGIASEQKPLAGLDLTTTRELLRRSGVDLSEEQSTALHTKMQGNGLLLVMMIELLKEVADYEQALQHLLASTRFKELMEQSAEQLSPEEHRVLEVLSVLEYPSTRNAIETVLDDGSLWRMLDMLGERRRSMLTINKEPSGTHYALHDLARAFYYDQLALKDRRAIHRRAGAYYAAEEIDTFKAAHHFEQAGEYNRAALLATSEVWIRINKGQSRALRELLERFNQRQLDAESWIAVTIACGEIDWVSGASDQARMSYEAALEQLETMPISDRVRQRLARVCRGIAETYESSNKDQALAWIERGLNEIAGIHSAEEIQLRLRLCSVLIGRDHADDLDAALNQIEWLQLLSGVQRADALIKEGVIYSKRGEQARAIDCSQRALKLYEQYGHLWGAIGVRHNLAIDLEESGDWEGAAKQYQKASEQARQLNDVIHQSEITLSWGILQTKRGCFDDALELLLQTIASARDAGHEEDLVYALPSMAYLRRLRGELSEAEAALQEAEALARREFTAQLPEIYREQALLQLVRQHAQSGLPLARKAIKLHRGKEPIEYARSMRVLGQVQLALGHHKQAQRHFKQSLQLFSRLDLPAPYETALTQAQFGIAQLEEDRDRACSLLAEAQATFDRLGACYDLAAVQTLLASLCPSEQL